MLIGPIEGIDAIQQTILRLCTEALCFMCLDSIARVVCVGICLQTAVVVRSGKTQIQ